MKMIALLRRKAGLSTEAFRDYYEAHHVPLIKRQQGPTLLRYSRNYVIPGSQISGLSIEGEFDVVTECDYADRAGMETAMARLSTAEATSEREADEKNFLDRAAIRVFFVEECAD